MFNPEIKLLKLFLNLTHSQMIKIKKELNCLRQRRKIQEKTKRNKSLQQYQKNRKKLFTF